MAAVLLFLVCEAFYQLLKARLPGSVRACWQACRFWPTLPLTYFSSWWTAGGLWCEVDDTVLLGVAPVNAMVWWWRMRGTCVVGVVNVQAEYSGPTWTYGCAGIRHRRFLTLDGSEPLAEDLKEAVRFIQDTKRQRPGGKVYVHCKFGHGRSAAVVLCWMAARYEDRTRQKPSTAVLQELNAELLGRRRVRRTLWSQPNIREFVDTYDVPYRPPTDV